MNGDLFLHAQQTLERELDEKIFISGLVGPLKILQRAKGHRHSIDDAMTAWYALQKAPNVGAFLDLGTGIGSVGLAVLWGLGSDALCSCIEAQQVSYRLLGENIACNGLQDRVRSFHGDLRELYLNEKFPLVTGSPPYFPMGEGVIPRDSQKAHARFELRGHVGDYAKAAKRHLSDEGLFVFCFPYRQKQRGVTLVEEEGFSVLTSRDVAPTVSALPLFSLFSARIGPRLKTVEEPLIIVADERGDYTDEMIAIQRGRGFGPPGTNDKLS